MAVKTSWEPQRLKTKRLFLHTYIVNCLLCICGHFMSYCGYFSCLFFNSSSLCCLFLPCVESQFPTAWFKVHCVRVLFCLCLFSFPFSSVFLGFILNCNKVLFSAPWFSLHWFHNYLTLFCHVIVLCLQVFNSYFGKIQANLCPSWPSNLLYTKTGIPSYMVPAVHLETLITTDTLFPFLSQRS